MKPPIDYFQDLNKIVRFAIEEDLGSGDLTAQLIAAEQTVVAAVITREDALVCGRPWFDEVFNQIDDSIEITWLVNEGDQVRAEQKLLELRGNARSILSGERAALNFLQTLMATATSSQQYANLVKNTDIQILDTRKTLPGLRLAQKYAVKVGGCENHRIGLYDAFLVKENHIIACGSIAAAVAKARAMAPQVLVEVEAENLDEVQQAISAGADRVMLDNFNHEQIQQAIGIKTDHISYEISGNITADSLADLPSSGIDYVSSGALTKHLNAIDLSMRIY